MMKIFWRRTGASYLVDNVGEEIFYPGFSVGSSQSRQVINEEMEEDSGIDDVQRNTLGQIDSGESVLAQK